MSSYNFSFAVPWTFLTKLMEVGPQPVSMLGNEIGAIVAPFILVIKIVWVPFMLFGGSSILAALLTLTLLETQKRHIPNTLREMKELHKKRNSSIIPVDNRSDIVPKMDEL